MIHFLHLSSSFTGNRNDRSFEEIVVGHRKYEHLVVVIFKYKRVDCNNWNIFVL